jgi:hypothetical protein
MEFKIHSLVDCVFISNIRRETQIKQFVYDINVYYYIKPKKILLFERILITACKVLI